MLEYEVKIKFQDEILRWEDIKPIHVTGYYTFKDAAIAGCDLVDHSLCHPSGESIYFQVRVNYIHCGNGHYFTHLKNMVGLRED